jgi:hypothetical protein
MATKQTAPAHDDVQRRQREKLAIARAALREVEAKLARQQRRRPARRMATHGQRQERPR